MQLYLVFVYTFALWYCVPVGILCIYQVIPYCCVIIYTLVYIQCIVGASLSNTECTIVNRERFAGLNFLIFHGFQEYHESFSVNISTSLNNRHFWPRKCKRISMKTSVGLKPWTFSSANLSTSMVSMY